MKNKQPENEVEMFCLRVFKDVYGEDVMSFRFSATELVEMMAMAYNHGADDAKREEKNVKNK